MQAVATWRKGHEFLLEDGRAHSLLVDVSPEDGGMSSGTTAAELSVLALAGSLASTFLAVAHKHHLECGGLSVVLEGDPLSTAPESRSIRGILRLRTRADRSEVDAILSATLEICPVSRLFREAHVPMTLSVVVTPGPRPG